MDSPAGKPEPVADSKNADPVAKSSEEDEREDPPMAPGTKSETLSLYAGDKTKGGNYVWSREKPPLDGPVEDAVTAQFAMLVRKIQDLSNPTKNMSTHSVLIQSTWLKELLALAFKDYAGISTEVPRFEFSRNFTPFIHKYDQIMDAIKKTRKDDAADSTAKKHVALLKTFMEEEFQETATNSKNMIKKGLISFDNLENLFQPGQLVFTHRDEEEMLLDLTTAGYGEDQAGNPDFYVSCKYVQWDGTRFGYSSMNLLIGAFGGVKPISDLTTLPLDHHPYGDGIRNRMRKRGEMYERLARPGALVQSYTGHCFRPGLDGRHREQANGHVVIDTHSWNNYKQYSINPIFVSPFGKENRPHLPGFAAKDFTGGNDSDADGLPPPPSGKKSRGRRDNTVGASADIKIEPLSDDQLLTTPPTMPGFFQKKWLEFLIENCRKPEWQDKAIDRLVLDPKTKNTILAFTAPRCKPRSPILSIYKGKGEGKIILLRGKPGLGKTLTAETVAETHHRILYRISASDLGSTPEDIDQNIANIMGLCERWDAILLLDEADVYIKQRTDDQLDRNTVVAVFLRVLERYTGTMFLTSNNIDKMDQAFNSRIHITCRYPPLTEDTRRAIWEDQLTILRNALELEIRVEEQEADELAREDLDGRMISNTCNLLEKIADHYGWTYISYKRIQAVIQATGFLGGDKKERTENKQKLDSAMVLKVCNVLASITQRKEWTKVSSEEVQNAMTAAGYLDANKDESEAEDDVFDSGDERDEDNKEGENDGTNEGAGSEGDEDDEDDEEDAEA